MIPKELPWHQVVLHPEILEIPFLHRKTLSHQFNDVLGLYQLDHLSIEIIDPEFQWMSLTSTPTMLHNLMKENIWLYDGSISPDFFNQLNFYTWQEAYHQTKKESLKRLKETQHGFRYGFCLVRRLGQFNIIYSFATKSILDDAHLFYLTKLNDLLKMGDYCLKNLKSIYYSHAKNYILPAIRETAHTQLKLIANNQRE